MNNLNSTHLKLVKDLKSSHTKIENLRKDIKEALEKAKNQRTKREQISEFFSAQNASFKNIEDLKKVRDYFVYLQKSIFKYYTRSVIISTDLFELKDKQAMLGKSVSILAGTVPFIGGILSQVSEKAFELKKEHSEKKFIKKSMKFPTIVTSVEILNDIAEETAFRLVKNQNKIDYIVRADSESSGFFEKINDAFNNFMDKLTSEKKKEKRREKKEKK